MQRIKNLFHILVIVFLTLGGTAATAQNWPSKQVRMVVPFSAGGATDAIARYLAKEMEPMVKQPVIVENISGAGSVLGMQAVARGPIDGTSMVLTGSSSITIMKHTNSKLPIDPETALTPVTFVNTLVHWIVIKEDRPEKTFDDFVETIRKNPGKISISVNAIGGAAHLALANWAKKNKLDILIVPYRGSSAAMIDVLGGAISAHVDVVGSSLQFVKSGRARALAVLQEKPIAELPTIPTSKSEDQGGLLIPGQQVLAVKSGTAPEIVNRIYEVVKTITAKPEFIKYLKDMGFERAVPTPEESKEILTRESKKYEEIVRITNIKIN